MMAGTFTNKIYLVLKSDRPPKIVEKIITTIKPYLQHSPYYSLEILSLFLLPSVIKIIPLKLKSSKKHPAKSKSFLEILRKSDNYNKEFNSTISNLLRENIYISPLL